MDFDWIPITGPVPFQFHVQPGQTHESWHPSKAGRHSKAQGLGC